jgi:hypothetical protein
MLGKRLGKYNFSFSVDPKAKGKDKGAIGLAKVSFYFSYLCDA